MAYGFIPQPVFQPVPHWLPMYGFTPHMLYPNPVPPMGLP